MAEPDEPDKIWDEYDWERFLQQQDRKTEKYMELLERYIDDPNRDQIIAREMGWNHLLDKDGRDWVDNVDSLFDEELELIDVEPGEGEDGKEDAEDGFEVHPLYQASFALTVWIDQLFEEVKDLQNDPSRAPCSSARKARSTPSASARSTSAFSRFAMASSSSWANSGSNGVVASRRNRFGRPVQ
jgi:hypothetical protein